MHRIQGLIAATLLFTSCTSSQLKLVDWQKLPETHYTIPPYARHLAGYKIALDPGHGGNAHIPGYKRGPTGKREAEMNLRVAFFLKEFLEHAGASVFMTRTDDRAVPIKDRAEMAVAAGCDFMLSLHHNADENPETNYSAIFYHLTPEQSPLSMDLARDIYFGLVDALRLPQVLDDGLLTDRLFYPAGYGVLRRCKIPALLIESSFFTNVQEEKRLTDSKYNRREAYGIFLGLARWAAGGVPNAELEYPDTVSTSKTPIISYHLSDGFTERGGRALPEALLFPESVVARIDGRKMPIDLSADKRQLIVRVDTVLNNGYHTLQVDLQNMYKHHNFPRLDTLVISAPTDSIGFRYATQYLPADSAAIMPILLSLHDSDGAKVWDSTKVEVRTDKGSVHPSMPRLTNGKARVYFSAGSSIGLVHLVASTPSFSDTVFLSLTPPGQNWVLSGELVNEVTNKPVVAAKVSIDDTTWTLTDENGVYFLLSPRVGKTTLFISKDGYGLVKKDVSIDSMRSVRRDFTLKPNLDGLLHGECIILDAALGDTATGDYFLTSQNAAQANLIMVQELAGMLRWAGADPKLIRYDDTWISSSERIRMVNEIPEAWYLKVAYEWWDSDSVFVQTTIYPANKTGEKIAATILGTFKALPNTTGAILQNTDVPEVTLTNKTAVEVRIRCRQPNILGRDLAALFRGIVEYYRLVEEEKSPGDN